jgi:hypothetical protein
MPPAPRSRQKVSAVWHAHYTDDGMRQPRPEINRAIMLGRMACASRMSTRRKDHRLSTALVREIEPLRPGYRFVATRIGHRAHQPAHLDAVENADPNSPVRITAASATPVLDIDVSISLLWAREHMAVALSRPREYSRHDPGDVKPHHDDNAEKVRQRVPGPRCRCRRRATAAPPKMAVRERSVDEVGPCVACGSCKPECRDRHE